MKIVVVGAGAAGVCGALILARYGHEVTLLEAGGRIAPLLRGFSRGGLQFDTGFHHAGALGPGGILRRYFNFCGLGKYLAFTPYRSDCCELFRFTAGEPEDVPLPQGYKAAAKSLAGRWPEHAGFISGFLSELETAYRHSPFIDPRRMSAQALMLPSGGKLSAKLDWRGVPARLRSMLAARSIYYGTPPERCLFDEFALVNGSMQEGVYGVEGGGAALAYAFEKALSEAGVTVHTGCAVTALNAVDGRITEVVTAKRTFTCEHCIYTGHPGKLPGMLPKGSLRPAMTRHLLSLEETSRFIALFGGTSSDFLDGRSLVLCLSDDIESLYETSGNRQTWLHISAGTPDRDGRRPVAVLARMDALPQVEEDGSACLSAAASGPGLPGVSETSGSSGTSTPLGAGREPSPAPGAFRKPGLRPAWYANWKKETADRIAGLVTLHVPELQDLNFVEASTEYSMRDWIAGSTGSIYGVMHTAGGAPVLPFTRVGGLVLAGQNVLLPGVLGAFISAAVACGHITGYERLFRDLACVNAE